MQVNPCNCRKRQEKRKELTRFNQKVGELVGDYNVGTDADIKFSGRQREPNAHPWIGNEDNGNLMLSPDYQASRP